MPDYKEMYLEMVRETEKAINILIDVQRRCEEMYVSAPEAEIVMLPSERDSADCQKSPPQEFAPAGANKI